MTRRLTAEREHGKWSRQDSGYVRAGGMTAEDGLDTGSRERKQLGRSDDR